MANQEKIYYSLDIETSGFDPVTNEILEVGIAGFRISDFGFRIVEKWDRVFKPKGEVSHHVLGLTGLTSADLEKGGAISDELFFLQGKLGTAAIVGHNVGFDIKFLQKCGIKFFGPVIDTMDLVQFLLPTHHSYNLENLASIFKISHKNAHRALADAMASMELLERLLGVYQSLPNEAKTQITGLAERVKAPWSDLLKAKIKPYKLEPAKPVKKISVAKSRLGSVVMQDKTVYIVDPFVPVEDIIGQIVSRTAERLLIVVPKRYQVLETWRQNLARGIFQPRHMFDRQKFEVLLHQDIQNPEQARFLMKLLVWQATNWQTECLLDLNLSFFGGQFQGLVSGRQLPEKLPDRVLCCDQQTFLELKSSELFRQRGLIVIGLGDFEAVITATIGQRSSWGFLSYLLKTVYDPETGFGDAEYRDIISRLLSDADLFFGLTNALLLKFNKGWGEVSVTDELRNSEEFLKIMSAAENFTEKLSSANQSLKLQSLTDFASNLKDFFEDRPTEVKWISFGERSCSFHSLPLDIGGIVGKSFSGFEKVCVIEPQGEQVALDYFINRLGMGKFSLIPWPVKKLRSKLVGILHHQPICRITPAVDSNPVKILSKADLPAVMVFDSPAEITKLYKEYYGELKKRAFLLVERSGGGSNRLFRNFSIHKDSLLLISSSGVLNFLRSVQQVQPVAQLQAKTVIFSQWPSMKVADPYSKALAQKSADPDREFFLPRSMYDFQSLLRFFYTAKLKQIIILDAKKAFKYKELYQNHLKSLFRIRLTKGD